VWAERSMMYRLAGLLLLTLAACSNDPGTGPQAVKWDRDACERCRMVISDRHFAAQVRYFPAGKRSRLAAFDDIGCASLWLDGQPWKDDPRTELWVADYRTGEWIDARTATYVENQLTPMEYGLGAQAEPVSGGLNFAQAKQRIVEVEKRFGRHGVQLLDRLKEQAAKRQAERQIPAGSQ